MKFRDLKDRIVDDMNWGTTERNVVAVLNWLDCHPDQVPGRTITAAKLNQAVDIAMDSGEFDTDEFARQLGTTIDPDPKPTNEEKLAEILRSIHDQAGPEYVAESLDELGVKAPGGDDE